MIRYSISPDELRRLIEAHTPGWFARAEAAQRRAQKRRKVLAADAIWSEIKPVFIKLQGGKCAYCESSLEGKISSDVEHFRPKNAVSRWPESNGAHPIPNARFGRPSKSGYLRLAFDVSNYSVSCKTCNTIHKGNRFPIRHRRKLNSIAAPALRSEGAWLIHPLDRDDEDPEEILDFVGVSPAARLSRGHRRERALVILAFFQLGEREALLSARALWITHFHGLVRDAKAGDRAASAELARASEQLKRLPHAACVRAYLRLCAESWPAAKRVAREARRSALPRELESLGAG